MLKKCPFCKIQSKFLYDLDKWYVLKCPECSFVYVNENLSSQELNNLYNGDFYGQYLFKVENIEEKTAQELKEYFKEVIQYVHKGNLLDLGCAQGDFLARLDKNKWNLFGADISSEAIKKGQTKYPHLNLIKGELEEINFSNNFFDVITLWDVIEHLKDPASILRECYRILKPSGVIVIKTPNENSLLTKLGILFYRITFGKANSFLKKIYNLSHINSFSPESLSFNLKRTGFKALKTIQQERYVTLYCLDEFSFPLKLGLVFLVKLSRALKREASFTLLAQKN